MIEVEDITGKITFFRSEDVRRIQQCGPLSNLWVLTFYGENDPLLLTDSAMKHVVNLLGLLTLPDDEDPPFDFSSRNN